MVATDPGPWWRTSVIYQVYPRSFQDSDGDGIGDLKGVERRLDHLVTLGVDAVWLSPIYPSPMADFGYDVADYTGVDPVFGTLADLDVLIDAIRARGLKLLLDLVPNHSSDQHPWFVASRSSRDDPKRDWYIWRDAGPNGAPPNNWISDFGGSAWAWDAATGQFYLHAFLKEQPDLNWRNPAVQAAMLDAMRFWLERGVDGFRIDVLWHMVKRADLADNPPNPEWRPGDPEKERVLQLNSTDQPEVHAIAAAMRTLADEYGALLVGEVYLPVPRLMTYYGTLARPEVQLPFNFHLIEAEWSAAALGKLIADYDAAVPDWAWPNWVLGNHDRPRIATRVGGAQARVAAMMLLTLRGTPTIYQGEELGLTDVAIPPEAVRDPQELRAPGQGFGRDPVRTPLPWDASLNAGFTTGEPWLPLGSDWPTRNVTAQEGDPASILSLYRAQLALRRERTALTVGGFALVRADGDVLAYERRSDNDRLLIALNIGGKEQQVELPDWASRCRALLSTHLLRPDSVDDGVLSLAANEGVILGPTR